MESMMELVATAIRNVGDGCQDGAVYVYPRIAAMAAIKAMAAAQLKAAEKDNA